MQYLVEVRTYGLAYDRFGEPGCQENGDLGNWEWRPSRIRISWNFVVWEEGCLLIDFTTVFKPGERHLTRIFFGVQGLIAAGTTPPPTYRCSRCPTVGQEQRAYSILKKEIVHVISLKKPCRIPGEKPLTHMGSHPRIGHCYVVIRSTSQTRSHGIGLRFGV